MSFQRLITLLFFLSGLASLVLETVWVRMMVLVFGSTTFAVSTVVTAFMAGLALGSWLAGRRADGVRPGRMIVIYGVLELGIGLYALAMPTLAGMLPQLHAATFGTAHSSYLTFGLLRFTLAAALLALPTVAMGATLPVLARFVTARGGQSVGQAVGTLYAVNTAGAVAGVALAGFVLLPSLGMRATNLVACVLDLALGLAALGLGRFALRRGRPEAVTPQSEQTAAASQPPPAMLARLALWSIAVSGAVAMVYQVGWTRILSLIIGSSTYAFSLILVCFLLGLAAGAAVYARRKTAQLEQQAANLSVIHLLTAFTCFGGTLVMDRLPVLLLWLMQRIELAPLTMFLIKFAVAGTVILLPTFFMGMVFPAVVRIVSAGATQRGAARTTGDIYAVNTLGAIAGSFLAGFVLVPLIGLQRSMVAVVLVGLLLAGLFGLLADSRRDRRILPVAVLLVGLAVLLLARPWDLEVLTSGVFRVSRYDHVLDRISAADKGPAAKQRQQDAAHRWWLAAQRTVTPDRAVDTYQEPTEGYQVISHKEGVTTTVTMARTVDQSISSQACWVRQSLLVNGKPDASLSVLHRRPTDGCGALLRRRDPLGPGLAISASGDAETQLLSGLLPLALHQGRTPRRVLVIGWGSGITIGAVLRAPVKRVVAVELEQEVVAAARAFEPHNNAPQADPRVQVVYADGRNYLATTTEKFDVIISEPSNPWMAGCGNLFTQEFFRLVRRSLAPDGVFLQWLQAYEIAPRNVWSIMGTLSSVFPSVHVFSPAQAPTDMLMVARPRPGKLSWRAVTRQLSQPGVRGQLELLGVHGPEDLAARLLASPAVVHQVSRGAAINTDDNARIEFAAPRDLINYSRYSARAITRRLRQGLGDPLSRFSGVPADARARLCRAALRSGRLRWLKDWTTTGQAPALRRCLAAARILARIPDPVTDPKQAIARLAATLSPGRDPTGFAQLGQLHARAGQHLQAVALLTAAQIQQQQGRVARYPRLDWLLAHELYRSGQYVLATRQALLLPLPPE